MKKSHLFYLLVFLSGLFLSCKREFEKPRWDTHVLGPLVKSKLTIRDIIKDSSKISTASDNSISIVNRQQIVDYTIDSLVTLKAGEYKNTVKLSSLVLADQTITQRISLGSIALQLINSGNSSQVQIGQGILAANFARKFGAKFQLDAISNITAGPVNVDISQFFKTAVLLSGSMDISITNDLPTTISTLKFSLTNGGNTITSQEFDNIAPGSSAIATQDLSGETIGSSIQANIQELDIDATPAPVLVDTSDAILVTLTIRNVKVSSATAIFPAQDVVNDTADVQLLGLENVELTKTIIRQGSVHADVTSTAQDTVRFTYEIPAATKDGHTFSFDAVVPPASPGQAAHAVFDTDFSGYLLDLRGEDGQQYNKFYNVLIGKIKYTGRIVTLSLQDSLDIHLSLVDPKPSYIKGYLGQDTVAVGPGTVDIDIFKNISANTLDFKTASLDVAFENGLGIPAQATLTSLSAINTAKATNLSLTGTPIVASIGAATDGGSAAIATTSVRDLSSGTNATDLLNTLPNKLAYSGVFYLNPAPAGNPGPSNPHTDFAYSGGGFKTYLDLKIPLSVIADNLVLKDTSSIDVPTLQTGGFQNGKFNLLVTNGFPLDVKVDMRFLDKNGIQIDSIITSNTILAAPVDANGKVTQAVTTAVPFQLNSADITTLINNATHVVFTARFDSKPSNTYINIYSDNEIDFKLIGDMNIQVNSGQ